VRAADAATILLLVAGTTSFLVGGYIVSLPGLDVVVKAPDRHVARALLIAMLRHALYRRPTVIERIRAGWQRARTRWPVATDVLPVALATRIGVLLVGYVAVATIGFEPGNPPMRFAVSELRNLPVRWDAGWYIGIAIDGYNFAPDVRGWQNVAFFPAYPMLVRAAGLFQFTWETAHVAAWTGVALSLVAFCLALVYVYRIALQQGTPEAAHGAVLLLAAYPFAVYYSAPFTESLFLLAVSGAFYHQVSRQFARAALWGLVAGLTRPNGILVCVPLGIAALRDGWAAYRDAPADARVARAARAALPGLAAAATPVVGVLVFSAVCWAYSGDPLLWVRAQRIGWDRPVRGIPSLWSQASELLSPSLAWTIGTRPYEVINYLAAVFALAACWPVARRVGIELAAFVAVSVLLPLVNGGFASVARFTAVLFPVFLWLGLALPARGREALAALFLLGQGVVAALFFTWRSMT